jgi:hypothetical protein
MKSKSEPDSTFGQLEQARQLLDLGHHGEALNLALDALMQELHNLQESLASLKTLALADPVPLKESPQPSSMGRPGETPRLH